jgi:hypothetical protein
MRKAFAVAVCAAALVAVPAAGAQVKQLSVSSPVAHGNVATLVVSVSPRATCSIMVLYKSGPSHAHGLSPKRGGTIAWSWIVGTRTTPGRWSIRVECGSAGSLATSFVVT